MNTLLQVLPIRDLCNIVFEYVDEWKDIYHNMVIDFDSSVYTICSSHASMYVYNRWSVRKKVKYINHFSTFKFGDKGYPHEKNTVFAGNWNVYIPHCYHPIYLHTKSEMMKNKYISCPKFNLSNVLPITNT